MQTTLRLFDHQIARSFLDWAAKQRESGVRLICVEGLPCSGKSWLLKKALDAKFRGIELDRLLPKDAPASISWVDQVRAGGAVQSILDALDECDCVVVDGPAAWLVVEPVVEKLGRPAARRLYLKEMSIGGGLIEWDEDEPLKRAATCEPYWRSIYEHHGKDRPWLHADLIIERVPGK